MRTSKFDTVFEPKICAQCGQELIEKVPPCPNFCKARCPSYAKKRTIKLDDFIYIWVMGAPCSGKRNICAKLAQEYKYHVINFGDVLREEIRILCENEDPMAKCLMTAMERYDLVPNDVVIRLLRKEITRNYMKKGFILKGFPREERQGFMFDKFIGPVTLVVFLELDHKVLLDRNEQWLRGPHMEPKKWKHVVVDVDAPKIRLRNYYAIRNKIKDQYPHKLVVVDSANEVKAFEAIKKELVRTFARRNEKKRQESQKVNEPTTKDCFGYITGEYEAPGPSLKIPHIGPL